MSDFLNAEAGVRQLQARYCDAVFRKDFDAFGDCFTEEAEWRIAGQLLQGRAQCRGLLEKVMPLIERVFMTFAAPIVMLDAGGAVARTYVTEWNASKGKNATFAIGIYYDRCVEQDGRWRFAWHHYQSYYNGPGDLSAAFRPIIDYGAPPGMPAPDEAAPMAGTGNI